jgi:hypothetical protein
MGRPHWASYLKYGDGNWHDIRNESKRSQARIDQIMDFDPLGYPRFTYEDRQMRVWGGSKRPDRIARKKKINQIIYERKKRKTGRS